MNPQGAELLSQLRDIHVAPTVPWWPPAPGWWVLAFLALAFMLWLLHRGWKAWRRRARRRRILGWVDAVERRIDPVSAPQAFVSAINRIFKAVALSAFPGQGCERLQGAAWVGFLQREMAGERDAEQLDVLAAGPYQPAPDIDPQALARLTRRWIMQYG